MLPRSQLLAQRGARGVSVAGAAVASSSRSRICTSACFSIQSSAAGTSRRTPLASSCLQRSFHATALASAPSTTPPAAAEASTSTSASSDGGSDGNLHFPRLWRSGNTQRYTVLPTPLPPDVLDRHAALVRERMRHSDSSVTPATDAALDPQLSRRTLQAVSHDGTLFPQTRSIENLSLLQACLTTGLVSRADKLFRDLQMEQRTRHEISAGSSDISSPGLDVYMHNNMIDAYLHKAWQELRTGAQTEWLQRAWDVLSDMASSDKANAVGPGPNAETIATMLKGCLRILQDQVYPANVPGINSLLRITRRASIALRDVFASHTLTSSASRNAAAVSPGSEPTIDDALQSLRVAATEVGDQVTLAELQKIETTLAQATPEAEDEMSHEAYEEELLALPELKPTLSTSAKSGDKLDSPILNLRILQENLETVREARSQHLDDWARQRALEHSALDAARKRLQASAAALEQLGLQNAGSMKGKFLQQLMWEWSVKLEARLTEDIARLVDGPNVNQGASASLRRKKRGGKAKADDTESTRKGKSGFSEEDEAEHESGSFDSQKSATKLEDSFAPLLKLLPPRKLAFLTVIELMRLHGTGNVSDGLKTTRGIIAVGRAVETEHYAEIVSKNPSTFRNARRTTSALEGANLLDLNKRRLARARNEAEGEHSMNSMLPNWSVQTRARIGSYLVQHLMDVAVVHRRAYDREGNLWEEDQPAFMAAYQYVAGKRTGVLRLNEEVSRKMDKDSIAETLHPRFLPMVVPPRPWLKHNEGGYYSTRTDVMRMKDAPEQVTYLKTASDAHALDAVLASLDVLGRTPWNINRPIFEVMTQVWNSGADTAEMPPAVYPEPEPQRPDNYETDIRAKAQYIEKLKTWSLKKSAAHSQRCDVNYKLEIARAFIGETFYFPHNMDFRGRAYPIPPHFNHIGNDLCRGLMLFAVAKPLGAAGLRWLRIHLANVYGYDKASFAEREAFAKDNEANIRASAANPLGEGERWWLKADDPWQCLATCKELVAALDHPEGPENFKSKLPVHQDGTCNGLQHYAALGGDLAGAKQVNLSGGDRPSDVYTGVADLVEAVIERDAKGGKNQEVAQLLQGKITRKVVKQTVMTTVYGVTFIGAKNQVHRQLADRGDIATDKLRACSIYLAQAILMSVGDLFTGAELIQEWLHTSAKLIARSIPPERVTELLEESDVPNTAAAFAKRLGREQMTAVIWTTPLGLPVVQPYRKQPKKQILTALQTCVITDPGRNAEVSPAKQASAFPPNFIHSLDATHMFLTALECQNKDLTFASVHDSYWTHACDIDTMSDYIRDTFVRLHSSDILTKLKAEFIDRYAGYQVPIAQARAIYKTAATRKAKADSLRARPEKVDTVEAISEGIEESPSPFENPALTEGEVDEAIVDLADEADDALIDSALTSFDEIDTSAGIHSQLVDIAKVLPAIPAKGSFDVNEIKRSLYFFS